VQVDGRLTPPVEAAAYFLIAEALTNVARYAHATSARVEVRHAGDEVLVLIADDGVGGVDLDAGSGLRGLQDRLAAVGGTLSIDSPPGAGTRLHARIPCPAEVPA
jgi:signal transduction histidine kinase